MAHGDPSVERRDDLDVVGVGHGIERERFAQDEAFVGQADGVASEGLRIARDVDRTTAGGEGRIQVLAVQAGARRGGICPRV
jgi:hypothetical protein